MRIASDGTWFYMKTPIGRPALVKLFASVLKRDGDKYFLVTPVEKCGITVDDAPFLAVELKTEDSGSHTAPQPPALERLAIAELPHLPAMPSHRRRNAPRLLWHRVLGLRGTCRCRAL
jgi:Domain of unknown function (DUF1285), N-terminal domain